MNIKNTLLMAAITGFVINISQCDENNNKRPKVTIDSSGQVWTSNTENIFDICRGFLRQGEPIVILYDINIWFNPKNFKDGRIVVLSQEKFLDPKSFPDNGLKTYGNDTYNTYASFTRCNGFPIIEEHSNQRKFRDEDQRFNPCENVRVQEAVKAFLKEERKAKKPKK